MSSLLGQDRPPDLLTVIDNASTDGSPDLVRTRFPGVRLVEPGANLGYAAACNLGWKTSPAELVVFLNNDLTVAADWLQKLLVEVEAPWGFWASRIVFSRDPGVVDSAGDAMAVVGAAYKIGHGEPVGDYLDRREVFGPCGAAAVFRREVLEATGGFDEDFFLIYEDADLSFRARILGYRCLYVPSAVVYHDVNRSIGTLSETYVYYGHRNSEIVFWKNQPTALLMRYLPERILFDVLSLAYFILKRRARPFLRAKRDFLRTFPSTLAKRRRIQAAGRINSSELRRMQDRNWIRHRLKKAP